MPFDQPAMLARLQEISTEFDVPMPELAYEDGAVLLTDELQDWHERHNAPLDWTLFGDARSMLRAYRTQQERERPLVAALKKLDPEARDVLLAGLHAHAAGVPMDDALAAVREVVEARRAEVGAH